MNVQKESSIILVNTMSIQTVTCCTEVIVFSESKTNLLPAGFVPRMVIKLGDSWRWNSASITNPSTVSVVRAIHSSACLHLINTTLLPAAKQSLNGDSPFLEMLYSVDPLLVSMTLDLMSLLLRGSHLGRWSGTLWFLTLKDEKWLSPLEFESFRPQSFSQKLFC